MRDRNYLFASGDLSASIEGHRQKKQQQIHALSPNQLLPAEDATVCQHFVADFTINPVEIQEEHIVLIEPREIEVERASDFGGTYRQKQLEFRFEIPFTGDACRVRIHTKRKRESRPDIFQRRSNQAWSPF